MLNLPEAMQTVVRENLKGGTGAVPQKILIKKEDLSGYARHCVIMTLDPGCSIGPHDHVNEAEFFYVLEGEVITKCDGKDVPFRAGDASFTTGAIKIYAQKYLQTPAE